jgi:aspartate 1-decarboxylase
VRRTFLRSKLHRARVTDSCPDYEGSLSLDATLMRRAGILPFERIEVYNITRGTRFATYAIEGAAGSREVVVNGAAAHLASRGDVVIVATYCELEEEEVVGFRPTVLILDEHNEVVEQRRPAALAGL